MVRIVQLAAQRSWQIAPEVDAGATKSMSVNCVKTMALKNPAHAHHIWIVGTP